MNEDHIDALYRALSKDTDGGPSKETVEILKALVAIIGRLGQREALEFDRILASFVQAAERLPPNSIASDIAAKAIAIRAKPH